VKAVSGFIGRVTGPVGRWFRRRSAVQLGILGLILSAVVSPA
jgi:hypothetical protein